MPNHIKNRIELKGSKDSVKSFVEMFSTIFPETESKAYDGRLICKSKDGKIGWLDKESSVFSRRNEPSVLGMPEEYEIEMEAEWTRFPDFNKVYPVPEVIRSVGDSVSSHIIDAVHAKYKKPFDSHPLIGMLQAENRNKFGNEIKPEDQMQFERACKAYEETGFAYWYDYQNAKWGTKWNAYNCEMINENTFQFDTAWSAIPNMIKEMSKHFDGEIIYIYADEDTGYNAGTYLFISGLVISDYIPCGGSVDAYEIAFDLRPDRKENYKLIDGTYQYIDEDED